MALPGWRGCWRRFTRSRRGSGMTADAPQPPQSLTCQKCRFDVGQDDVAFKWGPGVVCVRCRDEMEGMPLRMDKRLLADIERTVNGAP